MTAVSNIANSYNRQSQSCEERGRISPRVVRNLKAAASNGDPERGALVPQLREIVERIVLQLAAHAISRDYEARGAGVHNSREVLTTSGVSELEQLHMVVLFRVTKRERGDTDDTSIFSCTLGCG